MEGATPEKLDRISRSIQQMIYQLESTGSLKVHLKISESFYLQKVEELKVLNDQLKEAMQRLEAVKMRADKHYKIIYCTWRDDVRWLNTFLRTESVL